MFEKLFQKRLKRIEKRGERQKAKQEAIQKYAEYYPSSKRKVSNVMLVVVVIAITIYTVASFWLTYVTGVSIDSTLTTCFYAFWTSEVVALMGIKCSKVFKESKYGKFEDGVTDEDEPMCENDDENLG
jgi:uncharacterized membrane protein YbaN (DUF454 family)